MKKFCNEKAKYQKPIIDLEESESMDVLRVSGGDYSIDGLADGVIEDNFGD